MAKEKFKRGKKEFKRMSGKNEISGQFALKRGEGKNRKDLILVEQQQYPCEPYYAERYWLAFKDFLDHSGQYGRTFYLYKTMNEEPTPEELEEALAQPLSIEERKKKEELLEVVKKHYYVMRERQHCNSLSELYKKAEEEWYSFQSSLNRLSSSTDKANVKFPKLDTKKRRKEIMIHFCSLLEKFRGNRRRDYYREKFVSRSLKQIYRTGFAPPISIYDMEKQYLEDLEWQAKYDRRKGST